MNQKISLNNPFTNEFGELEGTAFFPYFNREITVRCRKGVSSEYIETCLEYLGEVDDALMLQICKYAEFFLQDKLENTSIGELGDDDEEAFPYDTLLDLLQYIQFEELCIEEPPKSVAHSSEIYVLNLTGGCDWWEDEGLQCLVRDREVIYLGYFGNLSVWGDYSREYIGNYVLYETFRKRLAENIEKNKNSIAQTDDQQPRTSSDSRRIFADSWDKMDKVKINQFLDYISEKENITCGEAATVLGDSYLYELMNDFPQLLEESLDFWCQCYCIEKEQGSGELMRYICENCEEDLF